MSPFLRTSENNAEKPSEIRSRMPAGKRHGSVCLMDIKVVPGARNDQITGILGTRIKIRVSAPPESGKANKAACRLIAKALDIKGSEVTVIAGKSSPEKTIRISGVSENTIRERLNLP